ncbi:MAG: single-stranded DNA-binding protein, partial [Elusimicrobia bacterium]|nr:single-stranded DNA-binding protein [Elusimicrobiota bacterium]
MSGVRLPEQNQVMLTGRLTRDPDIFFTQQGTAKCFFSVAVNQNYKDKASGEWKQQTTYVPVVVWREAAQRCKDRLRKGSPVYIEGRLRSRDFEDKKTGGKRTVLEVEARRVQFLATEEKDSSSSGAAAAAAQQGAEAEESAGG